MSNDNVGHVCIQAKRLKCHNIYLINIARTANTVTSLLRNHDESQLEAMQNGFVLNVLGNWERWSAIK